MTGSYAEVIGDPIAQSKSPIIHGHWLRQLGMDGDYRKTHVSAGDLAEFFHRRRSDPHWRGCNVTVPHKEHSTGHLDRLDAGAEAIGAVNCIVPDDDGLAGFNTDIDGVAAALDSTALEGSAVAVIGAGGASRAAVTYLCRRRAGRIVLLVRDPKKAQPLRALAPDSDVEILPIDRCDMAFESAAAIVNASPLGMAGAPRMPRPVLESAERHARGSTLFDMVTTPARTPFLAAGSRGGARTIDGLTMLIGQARHAFELFFGRPAPAGGEELRDLLVT